MSLQLNAEWRSFGGRQLQYTHDSSSTKTPMRFSIYLPPQATKDNPVPVLYYLSGLTCSDENVVQKGAYQAHCARRGIALVCPDTSPRGANVEGEDEAWDFGSGAGFYINASEDKWKVNYNMYDYCTKELPELVNSNFPVRPDKVSIFGHSMGGHGALTLAFRNPDSYTTVSAFSPICNPVDCPWGQKAFGGYFGEAGKTSGKWEEHDATCLMRKAGPFPQLGKVLVDIGKADNFLELQLKPEALQAACLEKGQELELRLHDGYDHSYFFISTFMEDHINFHADALCK